MMRSLYNGISGLRNHQVRLDVIGNNIANVNTVGFKAGRITFEETLAQTLQGATRPPGDQGGINPVQVGLGMSIGSIDTLFSQGNIESTGQQTDLAIQGNGFFVVSDGNSNLFTRAGSFQYDAEGYLVNPSNGWKLQGILADKDGEIPSGGDITDIALPFGQKASAKATTAISYACNLNAGENPLGSIMESQKMLATAQSADSLLTMYNTDGQQLALSETDEVIFKVDATASSNILDLSNSEGTMLDLKSGDDVIVQSSVSDTTDLVDALGTGVHIIDTDSADQVLTFTAGDTVDIQVDGGVATTFALGTDFNTFGELAALMESYVNTVSTGATVKVETDGSFIIDNKGSSALTNLSITSSNAEFATALGSANGTIAINSATTTNRLNLYKTYRAGVDFNTLEEYAANVQEVIQRASTGATLDATTEGNSLTLDNSVGSSDLYGIKIYAEDRYIFNNAMLGIVDDISRGNTGQSEELNYIRKHTIGSDINTLSDLATELNNDMSAVSSGATVRFTNGKFTYDNSTGTENLSNISIYSSPNNGKFQQIMDISTNLSTTSGPDSSLKFLDVAADTDLLIDLYNAAGDSIGLSIADDITLLTGTVGDSTFADRQLITNLTSTNDLSDLVNQLSDALFGSNPLPDETIEITSDGKLKVTGAKGLSNAITGLTLGSGAQVGDNSNVNFSSALTFNTIQNAKDITHSASIVTYDTLGEKHTMKMTWTKSDQENEWTWQATIEGEGEEEVITGNSGKLSFNDDGSLRSFNYDNGATSFEYNPGNGAETVKIELDPGEFGTTKGITGFSSPSTTVATSQDGYPMGNLDSISIDNVGLVTGIFTNGVSSTIAQVALATFNNAGGLLKVGDNMYQRSGNSGDAVIGTAGKSIQATMTPGALEMSNVDLAQEFASMIVAQRGYQANARVISTSDEMLTELVNLKR